MSESDFEEHGRVLFDVFARNCTSRATLEHVTGRWGILALSALRDGTMRFNALRRRVERTRHRRPARRRPALGPDRQRCARGVRRE